MQNTDFSQKLANQLKIKTDETLEIIRGDSVELTDRKEETTQIAVLEDGHLRLILETGINNFEAVKQEMRKFYEKEAGDTNFTLGICNREKILLFDAENELYSQKYSKGGAEKIADEINDFIKR